MKIVIMKIFWMGKNNGNEIDQEINEEGWREVIKNIIYNGTNELVKIYA